MSAKFIPRTRQLTKAILLPLRPDGKVPRGRADQDVIGLGVFFINPTTWNEVKPSGWIKKPIPGLSDPHQQWVSGGARTITFEALVTNDRSEGGTNPPQSQTVGCNSRGQTTVVNRIGGIAEQIFNIPGLSTTESAEAQGRNTTDFLKLDISDKLAFYRSLTYPNTAASANRVASAPNLVMLLVGKTFGQRGLRARYVVDKVNIRVTKQHPDLTPIEAVVSFTLTELVDRVLSSDSDILTDS